MKTIQQILSALKTGYTSVSDLIPYKFNFSDEPDYYVNNSADFSYFGWGNAICIQSDGKIVIGGQSGLYDGSNYYSLVKRFNTDGTLDQTFTSVKFTGGDDGHIRDIKQLSNGILIVVGHFTAVDGENYNRIVRLNTDGSIDHSFNIGSGFNNKVLVAKVLDNDDILLGGTFDSYNGINSSYLAKLVDGNIDETFASNLSFNNNVYAIEVDQSGGIYVGGVFNNYIVKLNSDGTVDNSFDRGNGFNDRVNAIKIQSNGKLIVGGWFDYYNGSSCNPGVVRINTDGTVDNTFASEGTGINFYDGYGVQDLKIQSNGKIVVGGWFVGYNGLRQGRIIRLNSDGTKDSSFSTGIGFSDRVQKVEIDNSGNIFCVGFFYNYNGKSCTSKFNYINSDCSGGSVKLSSTGSLIGTSVANSYKSSGIDDGGRDMWDGGAYLNTDISESIPMTHSTMTISDSSDADYVAYDIELENTNYIGPMDGIISAGTDYFGDGSSYFTNLYPGLLVLAAKNININEFSITGGTGQDGEGDYESGYINLDNYVVYYKTSYGNSSDEPSINQMIILDGTDSGITQTLDDGADSDDHNLQGLSDKSELYVLIFGRLDQTATTEEEFTNIANAFLNLIKSPSRIQEIRSCGGQICNTPAFKCYSIPKKACTCAKMKYFNAGGSGAYVAAVTVCNLNL